MSKLFLLVVSTTLVVFACKKDDPSTPQNPRFTQNPNDTTVLPSVYIAGDSFDLSTQYLPFPVYWKNGRQVHLPHASYSSGTSIAVSDTNVYVSSSGVYSGNNVTYWKNRIGINLTDSTITYPSATSITLSGSDIYTVGSAYINDFDKRVPIYWKTRVRQSRFQRIPPAMAMRNQLLLQVTMCISQGPRLILPPWATILLAIGKMEHRPSWVPAQLPTLKEGQNQFIFPAMTYMLLGKFIFPVRSRR